MIAGVALQAWSVWSCLLEWDFADGLPPRPALLINDMMPPTD